MSTHDSVLSVAVLLNDIRYQRSFFCLRLSSVVLIQQSCPVIIQDYHLWVQLCLMPATPNLVAWPRQQVSVTEWQGSLSVSLTQTSFCFACLHPTLMSSCTVLHSHVQHFLPTLLQSMGDAKGILSRLALCLSCLLSPFIPILLDLQRLVVAASRGWVSILSKY